MGDSGFKIGPKPVGLAAKIAQKQNELAKSGTSTTNFATLNPLAMPERLGIVFDDSVSMYGKITDAHAGVEEFLRNCKPGQTAVTIYPMNRTKLHLTADLISLATSVKSIEPSGSTPLVATLHKMLEAESLTRAIVFSDGEPNSPLIENVVSISKEKKIPVDTVYFGGNQEAPISFMCSLAERTGGVFLHFDPAKTNFRTAFKYLTPGFYAMLSDKSVISDIESGKKV